MLINAGGEAFHIVAALEKRKDSPARILLGSLDDPARDLAVRALAHVHATERIAQMSIEPGRQQNDVRVVLVDAAEDVILDRREVLHVPAAAGKRNVLRETAAGSGTDLVRGAGAWIKRIAVHRGVEDVVALFEEVLRSISVMDVEVEDEHPLDSRLFAQPFRDAGDGVEETKPHRLGAFGVMSGRAGDDERAAAAAEHVRRAGERGAHRRARGGKALQRDRIVLGVKEFESSPAGVVELLLVFVHVHLGDDPARLLVCLRLMDHAILEPGTPNAFQSGIEASRTFRMSRSGVVLIKNRMGVNVQHGCLWYNSANLKRILQVSSIFLLTALLLAFFLWKSNLHDVGRILLSTSIGWFAVAFVVNAMTLLFRTIRWRILLPERPAFYPTFFANAIGYMLSTILPIRAGDVARPALLARRTRVRFSDALGTVLTERVLDLIALLTLFLFFCVRRWNQFNEPAVHAGAIGAAALLCVMLLLILCIYFFRDGMRRLHAAIGRRFPARFHDAWMRFFDAFSGTLVISERPAALAGIIVCTALIWSCLTSQFWFALIAAHRMLPFDSSLFLTATTTIGIAIPTPGGVGGFHKVCQYVLTTFYGFDIDSSVAVAVLFHAVGTLPVVVVGMTLFLREGLNWRQLSREAHVEET